MLKAPYNKAEISFTKKSDLGDQGSNSKTYIAHDPQLDAEIVIKEIEKSKLDAAAFFEESKVLYLSGHPNVVPVYYACEDTDSIFIAMPYYKRGSLNKLLNTRYLTVREIIVIGSQIASGLHNVHSKRLVHFDVKPGNVLMSDRGEALLADFGLTRRMNTSGIAEQDSMYFKMKPPEAGGAYQFTNAFDIYQFGLTLYRMCNGNSAFYAQLDKYGAGAAFKRDVFKHDVKNGIFPNRSSFLEHIPARLQHVIKHCLQPDPAQRPAAAIEVANELARINERFDWQYSATASERCWKRTDSERVCQITVDSNGKSHATKTMVASGKTSRITEFSRDSLPTRDLRRFLGDA